MADLYKCGKDVITVDVEEIAKTLLEALDNRVADLEDGLSTEAIVRAEANQILEDKKADRTEVYTRVKLNTLIPRLAFEQAMILLGYTGGYFEVLYEGYDTNENYYKIAGKEAIAKKSVYFDIADDGTTSEKDSASGSTEEIFLLNNKPVGFRIMDSDSISTATKIILFDRYGISISQDSGATYTTVLNINSEKKAANGDLQLLNGGVINWGIIKSTEASKSTSHITGGGILQIDLDNGEILSDKTDVIHLDNGKDISIYKDSRNSTNQVDGEYLDGKSKIDIIDDTYNGATISNYGYVKISKENGTDTFGATVTKESLEITNITKNGSTVVNTDDIASIKKNSFVTGEWHFDQDPDTGILSIYREID